MTERTVPIFHPNGECRALKDALGTNLPHRTFLESFRPRRERYLRSDAPDGLHGDGHSARVNVIGQLLAGLLKERQLTVDPVAIGLFAETHDLRRTDDLDDPYHGERAAAFFYDAYGTPGRTGEEVGYLDRWHVPHDRQAPEMTLSLAVAKDADGLDRIREEGAFDPGYLRLPESRGILVAPARALFLLGTEIQHRRNISPFDSVMEAAVELGIVRDG